MKYIFVFLIIGSFSQCSRDNKVKKIVHPSNNFYEVGKCIQDSVFHGKVSRYSLDGQYLGFATYEYGILNGLYVNNYANGVVRDSISYLKGYREGYAYKFDSIGKLKYKIYYLQDRPVGDVCSYNESGEITEYIFKSFEGKSIYSIYYNKKDTMEFGEMPYYWFEKIKMNDDSIKNHLFLYLISFPDIPMHYEIAKIHKGKILSSEKINSENAYYETYLDTLPDNFNYAVIMSIYNKSKGKNDLSVYVLDDENINSK